jgi:hypothetical protein
MYKKLAKFQSLATNIDLPLGLLRIKGFTLIFFRVTTRWSLTLIAQANDTVFRKMSMCGDIEVPVTRQDIKKVVSL